MKRIGMMVSIVVFIALCYSMIAAVCAEQQPVEPEFQIDNRKEFAKSVQGPVLLTHEKHSKEHKVACTECHHVYKDDQNIWKEDDKVEKCVTCHPTDRTAATEKFGETKKLDLKNAFHKNCQTCHKEVNKTKVDATGEMAPTKCKECHGEK